MDLVVDRKREEFQFAQSLSVQKFEFLRIDFVALRCILSTHFSCVLLAIQACKQYEMHRTMQQDKAFNFGLKDAVMALFFLSRKKAATCSVDVSMLKTMIPKTVSAIGSSIVYFPILIFTESSLLPLNTKLWHFDKFGVLGTTRRVLSFYCCLQIGSIPKNFYLSAQPRNPFCSFLKCCLWKRYSTIWIFCYRFEFAAAGWRSNWSDNSIDFLLFQSSHFSSLLDYGKLYQRLFWNQCKQ